MAVELGHFKHCGVVQIAEAFRTGRLPVVAGQIMVGVDDGLGAEVLGEAFGGARTGWAQVHPAAELLERAAGAHGRTEWRTGNRGEMAAVFAAQDVG